MKILVVDDEQLILNSVKKILKELEVDIAENVQSGFCLFYQKDYDLIISDLNIGDDNGLEMLKEMKETDSNVRTILMTGNIDYDPSAADNIFSPDGYLKKAFEIKELREKVYEVMS